MAEHVTQLTLPQATIRARGAAAIKKALGKYPKDAYMRGTTLLHSARRAS